VTSGHEPAGEGARFDASKPHMARVYDYWLGGKDNYAADRAVAGQQPGGGHRLHRRRSAGLRHHLGAGRRRAGLRAAGGGDAASPGSYLALSQIASDVAATEVTEGVQRYNEQTAIPVMARTHAEVCRFFAGLDLVEPGVVQVQRWRVGADNERDLAIYAGVARKP
jgi:hypothetical protein